MIFLKWLSLLIFLVLSFMFSSFILSCFIYFAAKIYLYFVRNIPFGTYLPGFFRIIKGFSFGAIIAGIGCWYIYYKNEKL